MTGCFDKAFSTALDNGGQVVELNNLVAGTGFFNRIGNGVRIKYIHLKGALIATTNVTTDDYAQIALIHDNGNNASVAVPVITDILATTNLTGAQNTTALSGINWNNRDRFSYIWQKTFAMPAFNAGAAGPADDYTFRVDEELGIDLDTIFNASTATIESGNIYFIAIGLQSPGTEPFGFLGEARMHFENK